MTRLKFLTGLAHPRRTYNPGDTADWEDDADAERIADAGFAEIVSRTEGKPAGRGRPRKTGP